MSQLSSATEVEYNTNQHSGKEHHTVRLCALEYAKHNVIQRKYSEFVLDFCQPAFCAQRDPSQQFLDVGCGTGDFTSDVLLPRCMPCRRIVGIDCSAEMIEYASCRSAHEKIEFAVLDIAADVTEFLEEFGQFERVFSFFCLQWVSDLGAALKNISRLMSPSGECFLVFPAVAEGPEVWKGLAATDRWEKYSKTLLKFVPETQDFRERKELLNFLSSRLSEAGLFPTIMEVLISTLCDGWSEDDIHATYMNTLPIVKLVSEEERLQLSADVKSLIHSVHFPGVRSGRYMMYLVKASKNDLRNLKGTFA